MKGVILQIEENSMVVLSNDADFLRVKKADGKRVGDTVSLDTYYKRQRRRRTNKYIKNITSLAACLVIVIGLVSFANTYDKTAYTVYTDINPSVRFEVNSMNNVISQTAMNKDGVDLLQGLDASNGIIDRLNGLIEKAQHDNYLTRDGVNITFVVNGDYKMDKVEALFERAMPKSIPIVITEVTPEEEQVANDLGVSPIKYKYAKKAADSVPGLELSEALTYKLPYLRTLIAEA